MKQRTLRDIVSVEGKGLHTGKQIRMELVPASVNTGIVFVRTDLNDQVFIKASPEVVLSPEEYPRRTSLGYKGVVIHTIEHLMAVLCGLMIDNVIVKLSGEEVPGFDGSGKILTELIKKVGIQEQEDVKKYLTITEPIYLRHQNAFLACFPYEGLKIDYLLDYNHPFLRRQFIEFELTSENFEKEICFARTFCLEEEVDYLRGLGLGKGADYSNTLVVSKKGVINNKLYCEDEFARHKLFDLLGDLYLLGPIKAYIIAIKSGHSANVNFINKIWRYKKIKTLSGVEAKLTIDKTTSLNTTEIMEILPHRYPFLLVDKILHLEPGKKAVGLKNVSVNEYFFEGHFPSKPIMPGVLIIEAMAQVGGVLMLSLRENRGKLAYFMAADKVKFRKTVEPGDTLIIEVEAKKVKSRTGIVVCKAYVEDKLAAEAELYFALGAG